MSSVESLFKSFVVLVVCLLSSVIITQFILVPSELIIHEIDKTGMNDVPQEWSSSDLRDFALSLAYFLTYFLDFYAIGQFVWTAIRKQRYDAFGNEISNEEEF